MRMGFLVATAALLLAAQGAVANRRLVVGKSITDA
jgi:hypothetical protein